MLASSESSVLVGHVKTIGIPTLDHTTERDACGGGEGGMRPHKANVIYHELDSTDCDPLL